MKVATAYICYSCEEVMDTAPSGKCGMCGSADIYPLGWLRHPEEERSRWVNRVNGRNRREYPANGIASS